MEFCATSTSSDVSIASNDPMEQIQELDAVEMECTICMECISEETVLPCQCKLHYCHSCWDKALANSFSQCGQARCPSCRAFVRVDFDAEQQSLVFTPETVDMTFATEHALLERIEKEYEQSVAESQVPASEKSFEQFAEAHEDAPILESIEQQRTGVIQRLRHQVVPSQVKMMQRYFEANPSLHHIQSNATETLATASVAELKSLMETASIDANGCLQKSEMIDRLVQQTDTTSLCCLWASQKCQAPKCACGCLSKRISGPERFTNCVRELESFEAMQREVQRRQDEGTMKVQCDICDDHIPLCPGSFLWSCENRNSSIFHATSYDMCDKCFVDSGSRMQVKEAEN